MEQAPQKAWADFEKAIYQRFNEFKYQPKAYVVFRSIYTYPQLTIIWLIAWCRYESAWS